MFDDIPENYRAQTADNEEEGWRYTQGDKNARRPPELLTRDHVEPLHHARGQGRPRQPARRRVPRHRVDQGRGSRTAPSTSRRSCRACTTSSSSWPTSTSPRSRWRSARRRTTSWAACGWTPTRRCRPCPACSPPASAPPASTARTGSAATRSPTSSCSASAPASTPRSSRRRSERGRDRRARRSTRPRAARSSRSSAAPQGEGPYQVQYELQEMMQDLVGIVRNEAEMQRALDGLGDAARARERASASAATASTTPAGTPRSTCTTC